ncbi:MAG: hypothetical protein GF307_13875 [candidate division Zixibacteria bacterium]|nr:hypothetical protein [candidate division Zixibacteria bacterium]
MQDNKIASIAYILLAVGLIFLVWVLIRTFSRVLGRDEGLSKFRSRFGGLLDFTFIILGVLLILGSQAFFWMSNNLKRHIILDGKTELGMVETFIRPEWDFKQGFHYMPVSNNGYGQSFSFELEGDSWYIMVEKIIWPSWTKSMGLRTSYKINSFYSGEGEPVVRDLIGVNHYQLEGGESGLLKLYNKAGGILLGMKAEVLKSKERNFISGRSYTIYADSTGIILQEMW